MQSVGWGEGRVVREDLVDLSASEAKRGSGRGVCELGRWKRSLTEARRTSGGSLLSR